MQKEEKKVKKSFFQGMKQELKKVIWPTGKQTMKSTLVTIVFVLLISAVLIVLNLFFNFLSKKWVNFILGKEEEKIIESGDVSGDALSGDVTIPEENANTANGGESGDTSTNQEVVVE